MKNDEKTLKRRKYPVFSTIIISQDQSKINFPKFADEMVMAAHLLLHNRPFEKQTMWYGYSVSEVWV